MDAITKENLAIAISAGIITLIVTFATFQYVRPTIKQMVNKEK